MGPGDPVDLQGAAGGRAFFGEAPAADSGGNVLDQETLLRPAVGNSLGDAGEMQSRKNKGREKERKALMARSR